MRLNGVPFQQRLFRRLDAPRSEDACVRTGNIERKYNRFSFRPFPAYRTAREFITIASRQPFDDDACKYYTTIDEPVRPVTRYTRILHTRTRCVRCVNAKTTNYAKSSRLHRVPTASSATRKPAKRRPKHNIIW